MLQRIQLIGNLGTDPEMRYTPAGKAVTNFNMATNKSWTDADGKKVETTIWWRVSVWGKQAESCNQYLSKGRAVYVEGNMHGDENGNPRVWVDKNGNHRASFELTASWVQFLGGGNGGGVENPPPVDDDNIPF